MRGFVVHNVLHLDDTPERIARGVALGFFVAWTPTIGLQMLIYLLLATVLRTNKVSGLAPVWLTNPVTAVPIYYANWWVGHALSSEAGTDRGREQIAAALREVEATGQDLSRLFEAAFWREMGLALRTLGFELWLGSLVVGMVLGAIGYFVTLRLIRLHRERRAARAAGGDATEL